MPTLADSIQLTDYASYRSYFQGLADSAKYLDFFAYTQDEFEKESSNPARGGWVMILEPYKAEVTDNKASQVMESSQGMFVIAKKKTTELKSYLIEEGAQARARKVIGKMKRDYREGILLTETQNITVDTIDPMVVAEYYGVVVGFRFQIPLNAAIAYDPDDYTL